MFTAMTQTAPFRVALTPPGSCKITDLQIRAYVTLPSSMRELLSSLTLSDSARDRVDRMKSFTKKQREMMRERRINVIKKLKSKFPRRSIDIKAADPSWYNSEGLPLSARDDRGRFIIPWDEGACDKKFTDFLKWRWERFFKRDPEPEGREEMPMVEFVDSEGLLGGVELTWIGHSTCFVRVGGVTILTDPVLSQRCSPSQYVGTERFVPPAATLDDLPDVDVVLISHDHYDHLDYNTILALGKSSPSTLFYVPMGTKQFLVEDCNIEPERVTEMEWWEEASFRDGDAKIVCTPAQHWCSRTPWDRNARLWCSWVVEANDAKGGMVGIGDVKQIGDAKQIGKKDSEKPLKFFFGGDSGRPKYFPLFSLIGDKYGPFDLAALPIGAYSPTWFMQSAHCSPLEAIKMHGELGAKQTVGIHWGTFPLADEVFYEPAQLLKAGCDQAGVSFDEDFVLLRHGETLRAGENNDTTRKLASLL